MNLRPKINTQLNNQLGKPRGRPKGSVNRNKAELAILAQQYTVEALNKLVEIVKTSKSETAVVMAAREILDRGHGRPIQAHLIDGTLKVTHEEAVRLVAKRIDDAIEKIAAEDKRLAYHGNGNGSQG
jgi:hypothetical protein